MGLSLEELRATAVELLDSMDAADDHVVLDERTEALIGLAVRASVAGLNVDGIRSFIGRALDAGATGAEVHETLLLVSGMGVHSLMVGSRELAALLRERGDATMLVPMDERRQRLWQEHVGENPFWIRLQHEVPGFLEALLRLSPEAFDAFFAFCAVPWRATALSPLVKELISMAADATPSHRYLPGLRLHLANSVRLGAGRADVLGALAIAAAAPAHQGIGSVRPAG